MTNWKIDMKNNEPVAYLGPRLSETIYYTIRPANDWGYNLRGGASSGILIRAVAFKSDLLQELLK